MIHSGLQGALGDCCALADRLTEKGFSHPAAEQKAELFGSAAAAQADSFLAVWSGACRQEFPQNAESSSFFLTAAGPAAFQIS